MPSNPGPGWHHERIVTRWEELQADFEQERELARLEARRTGHRRAQEQLASKLRAERDWFQRTNTRWRERTDPDADD